VTDLHPEQLLAELGRSPHTTIAPSLARHLEECDVCSLEVATRRGATEELDRRSPVDLESTIAGVMRELDRLSGEVAEQPEPDPVGKRRVAVAGLAAALGVAAVLLATAISTRGVSATNARGPNPAQQAVQTVADEPDSSASTSPVPASTRGVDLSHVPHPTPPEVAEPEPGPESATSPLPRASASPRPSEAASAAELFEEATGLIAEGDPRAALGVFEILQSTHPESREAHTSLAIAGRLRLDHEHDPIQALEAFDAYLRRRPATLRPEVLAAKATALDALGRDAEAREVRRDLARNHPNTTPGRDAAARIGDDL
jgi:hypothetical protein